jgi:hypothetical protein
MPQKVKKTGGGVDFLKIFHFAAFRGGREGNVLLYLSCRQRWGEWECLNEDGFLQNVPSRVPIEFLLCVAVCRTAKALVRKLSALFFADLFHGGSW